MKDLNPLKIPTDNLYKFIAITGLVLLVLGIVSLYVYATESTKIMFDRTHEEIMLEVKADNLGKILKKENGTLETKMELMEELVENITKKVILEKSDALRSKFVFPIIFVLSLIIFTGTVLMIKGFSLWYRRLQIYQDIIIKNEAEMVKKE